MTALLQGLTGASSSPGCHPRLSSCSTQSQGAVLVKLARQRGQSPGFACDPGSVGGMGEQSFRRHSKVRAETEPHCLLLGGLKLMSSLSRVMARASQRSDRAKATRAKATLARPGIASNNCSGADTELTNCGVPCRVQLSQHDQSVTSNLVVDDIIQPGSGGKSASNRPPVDRE